MRREYIKPAMQSECFTANEHVACCYIYDSHYYWKHDKFHYHDENAIVQSPLNQWWINTVCTQNHPVVAQRNSKFVS